MCVSNTLLFCQCRWGWCCPQCSGGWSPWTPPLLCRHDICHIFYTSNFSNILNFTRRKRVNRDIFSPLIWQSEFSSPKMRIENENFVVVGSLKTLSLVYMTEYYQKPKWYSHPYSENTFIKQNFTREVMILHKRCLWQISCLLLWWSSVFWHIQPLH